MISSIDASTGDLLIKLKFSTRAMVALEAANEDKPIGEILQSLASGVTVKFLVKMFSAVINDGEGGTEAEAMQAMDALGGPFAAVSYLSEAANAAFPEIERSEDDAAAEEGAAKPAGKRKPARAK